MFDIGGVKMDYPIMVGGGVCKTPRSVMEFMRDDLPIGAVETGSYTPLQRDGNSGTLVWPGDYQELKKASFGLNSFGMPNDGNSAAFEQLCLQHPGHTKPLIVNIAGFSVDDYVSGVQTFDAPILVSAIVVNGGCPNAHDGATVPISLDLDNNRRIFDAIGQLSPVVPIWFKISPPIIGKQLEILKQLLPQVDFSHTPTVDEEFIYRLAEVIRQYPFIRGVIGANTIGNCILPGPDGKPVTTPNGGKAGLSGPVLKEMVIELIRFLRTLLPDAISLIHSGGALSGDDVVDCLERGRADAVQCTSGPYWYGNGPKFFANLPLESERLQNYLAARM